jgi:hypothetical protein
MSRRKEQLLEILAEGCRVLPAYRARRAATQKCKPCVVVWEARCELKLRDLLQIDETFKAIADL